MAKTNEKYEALKGMREIEAKFRSTDSLEIETFFFIRIESLQRENF